MVKEYPKEDINVVWDESKCKHSANCVRGMSNVFNPKYRPWIQTENGTKKDIIAQVGKCPSGALTIKYTK